MIIGYEQLREKEVIDITSGERLGRVCDLDIDTECGRICALYLPGRGRLWGLFGRGEDVVLHWSDIAVIGRDTILVKLPPCRDPDRP